MGTTAEKGAYIIETKSLLKDKINNLGGSITGETTFRQYANQLQNVYDNLPKTEYQTGTEVNLGKTIKGKLDYDNGVVGIGQTEQDTTTGSQLIDFSTLSNSNTTNSFVNDTLEVSTNSGTYANAYKDITSLYKNNGGEVLRFDFSSISYDVTPNVRIVGLRVVAGSTSNITLVDNNKNISTHTIPSDTSSITSVSLTIYANNTNTAVTNTLVINKPILHFGATAIDFEKYTGGQASPSPSYPQEIEVVTGEQSVVVSGKNLYNDNAETEAYYYNASGEKVASPSADETYINLEYNLSDTAITISRATMVGGANIRICEYNGTAFIKRTLTNATSETITLDSNTTRVIFSINKSETAYFTDLMIEKGSTATTYEPYITPTSYQLSLGDKKLYEDCYIVGSPDNWKYVDWHEKIILKNLGWIRNGTSTSGKYRYYTSDVSSTIEKTTGNNQKTTKGLYSNILKETNADANYLQGQGICSSPNGQLYVYIASVSEEADTTALINLLTSTNAYAVIPLAQAKETPITDTTLISQLNAWYNAQSINGATIITSNGNLPMIVKVRGLKGE